MQARLACSTLRHCVLRNKQWNECGTHAAHTIRSKVVGLQGSSISLQGQTRQRLCLPHGLAAQSNALSNVLLCSTSTVRSCKHNARASPSPHPAPLPLCSRIQPQPTWPIAHSGTASARAAPVSSGLSGLRACTATRPSAEPSKPSAHTAPSTAQPPAPFPQQPLPAAMQCSAGPSSRVPARAAGSWLRAMHHQSSSSVIIIISCCRCHDDQHLQGSVLQ